MPVHKVVVDKAKAMRNGLTVAQVFQEINKKIAEAKGYHDPNGNQGL